MTTFNKTYISFTRTTGMPFLKTQAYVSLKFKVTAYF